MKTALVLAALTLSFSAFANPSAYSVADFLNHQDQVEIAASELALSHSQNPKVLAYAQRTAKNHSEANRVLVALVQATGTSISPLALYDQQLAALRPLRGAPFDRAFAQLMIVVHQDSLEEIAKADGSNVIGAFARVTEARVANGLAGAIGLLY